MCSLCVKNAEDKSENRSFKIKHASLIFDPKKFLLAAVEKTEFKHENDTDFNAQFMHDSLRITYTLVGKTGFFALKVKKSRRIKFKLI